MARTMDGNGNCYRAVLVYFNSWFNKEETIYFGPYDEPGKAKASRTRWKQQYIVGRNTKGYVISEEVQVTEVWRTV